MALFRYEAFRSSGEIYEGTVQAPDLDSAKSKLNERKILFSKIVPISSSFTVGRISKRDVLQFIEMLSQLLSVGLPLYEALMTLEEEYSGENLHILLSSFSEEVRSGASLSAAMALFPNAFPTLYRSMISAGEVSGELVGSLNRVAELIRSRLLLRSQLVHAFTYPAILGLFSCFVICFMLLFVIPTIAPLFEDRSVSSLTKFVLELSRLFVKFYIPVLPVSLVAFVILYTRYKNKLGLLLKKTLSKIPYFRLLFLHSELVNLSGTMGLLLEAGVDLIRALELAEQVAEGDDFRDQVSRMKSDVTIGKALSASLEEDFFPKRAKRLVRIGEETGSLGAMLLKISSLYKESLDNRLLQMTTLLQPAILVFMGAVVGLIIISVLLPLTDVGSLSGI
ncbi:type II secretion system F family protein [Candidatus Similichlamydia epinepheli]|uniref:type II secretion system F family protein n=1 Tax=Candidatus Similichlamydia epinepheli TaxID=1903953 RepID=UPI000D3A5C08|nr:type II secretion system F family protein [Candidatus Similichlamydia epinepheli]